MTNSTSTVSSNNLEEEFLDDLDENSDFHADGATKKHPGAFRTISEVAEEIHVPQHVLRFWETRFKQVQPLKRSGGRRYYRAEDISLLQYISELLYTQGYTIKGVQRLLDDDFSQLNANHNNVSEHDQQHSDNNDSTGSLNAAELQVEQEIMVNEAGDQPLSEQAIVNTLEVTRLNEENKLLVRSFKMVLSELQELRKIIATEC